MLRIAGQRDQQLTTDHELLATCVLPPHDDPRTDRQDIRQILGILRGYTNGGGSRGWRATCDHQGRTTHRCAGVRRAAEYDRVVRGCRRRCVSSWCYGVLSTGQFLINEPLSFGQGAWRQSDGECAGVTAIYFQRQL